MDCFKIRYRSMNGSGNKIGRTKQVEIEKINKGITAFLKFILNILKTGSMQNPK